MAKANAAWIAQREGRYAEAQHGGEEALELLTKTPQASMLPWVARFPLTGVALAIGDIGSAIEHAKPTLAPAAQVLPEDIAPRLHEAIAAWDTGDVDAARDKLEQAAALAREVGYL